MGIRRDAVKQAQSILNQAGAQLRVDGVWGPNTRAAYDQSSVATQQEVNAILAKAELSPAAIASYQRDGGDENKQVFNSRVVPSVLQHAKARGLNGRLMVAQLRLETGNGSRIPKGSNNWGGIKAVGGQPAVYARTKEAGPDGRLHSTTEPFRVFASPEEFAEFYVNKLATSKRYKAAYAARDFDTGARLLGQSGYATDPNYARKLASFA